MRVELLDESQRLRIIRHHPETAHRWLDRLPDLVATCRERWRLVISEPYRPGGSASWTAPVETADGTKAVLKIALPAPERIDLAVALAAYEGQGMVRLLAQKSEDHVSLIERCEPGTVAQDRAPAQTDDIAAAVLPQLWRDRRLVDAPHLVDLAARRARRVRDRAERLNAPLLDQGADLFDELVRPSRPELLLHGDFHPGNVLLSARGWLAIDPRPMLGEPAYDVAIHLVNQIHEEPDPMGRVTRLARRVGVPPDRACGWLAAQTIQLCSWLRDSGQPRDLEAIETAAHRLLAAL